MKIRLALASTAAVLVAAIILFFMTRTPRAGSPRIAADEPAAADVEVVGPAPLTAPLLAKGPATEAVRRSAVAEEPPVSVSEVAGTTVLRVVLEGITEEDARRATVTLTGVDKRHRFPDKWPAEIYGSWPCRGLTSEFDADPFFADVAERGEDLRVDELEVEIDHPHYFLGTTRVPLSLGVELTTGRTVYEARVGLVPPVFWPELTLDVRDVHTRAHLEDVEIRCRSTAWMGLPHQPGPGEAFTLLGDDLSSPIVLLGGREADEPEGLVAGLALRPAPGEAPEPFDLFGAGRVKPERGILVFARAPGYAWGSIMLDVSTGADRELLLGQAAALGVRLTNVQLERYAALEADANIYVVQSLPNGDERNVWFQPLDLTLETEGLRREALEPGEYAVSVELGGSILWRKRTVLVREELSLGAGETRELVLAVPEPPAPPERATLGGVVSFPAPTAHWDEESVRLQLYEPDYRYGAADFELSLADMEHVGGALPTWVFQLEDLPVGLHQIRLLPFEKNWMIELPAGGREDVKLVIPELAEVLVETVDAGTGARIPLEVIRLGSREDLPGRVHNDWSNHRTTTGFEGEPGRFRFWTVPGPAFLKTHGFPSGLDYGMGHMDLELVPGLQSVRFELGPACAIHFEFRVGGAALPIEDEIFVGLFKGIRAVDHEGRVTPVTYQQVEVSAPGLYEISFEGVGADRFHPIPPRRVDLRPGETVEVIVELRRK